MGWSGVLFLGQPDTQTPRRFIRRHPVSGRLGRAAESTPPQCPHVQVRTAGDLACLWLEAGSLLCSFAVQYVECEPHLSRWQVRNFEGVHAWLCVRVRVRARACMPVCTCVHAHMCGRMGLEVGRGARIRAPARACRTATLALLAAPRHPAARRTRGCTGLRVPLPFTLKPPTAYEQDARLAVAVAALLLQVPGEKWGWWWWGGGGGGRKGIPT